MAKDDFKKSIDKLQTFLEKARKKLSDEYDPYEDEGDNDLQDLQEFDPDSDDEADRWLAENNPEKEKENERNEYSEYDTDEDEEGHQVDPHMAEEAGDDAQEMGDEEDAGMEEGVAPMLAQDAASGPKRGGPQVLPQEEGKEEEVDTRGSERFPQPTKEDIADMRSYTRPWEQRARESSALSAEAHKNPVLHHEGRLVEARNAAHGNYQDAYSTYQKSPEYADADPISQMEMDAKFNQDWHQQNPEHLKNAVKLHERAHLHGLKGREAGASNKYEDIQHVRGGGAQAESPMSVEEGLQHVGGSKGEEGTEGTITQDPAAKFAGSNQEFLREKGQGYADKASKDKGTYNKLASAYAKKVGDIPDYSRDELHRVLGDHPALKDPKKKAQVNAFFEKYHPLIRMNASKVMNKLGLDRNRGDIDMDAMHEAGMHGLFHAINDYEHDNPSKASFSTHAGHKIRGLMQTALREQQSNPNALIQGAKKFNQGPKRDITSMVAKHPPEVSDRLKRIQTYKAVNTPKLPKPEGENT